MDIFWLSLYAVALAYVLYMTFSWSGHRVLSIRRLGWGACTLIILIGFAIVAWVGINAPDAPALAGIGITIASIGALAAWIGMVVHAVRWWLQRSSRIT
ncbi:hypothetical protein [Burkholderia gladioli]|uniref:hypothetical protein n=1 Tax=Burkholderia gladioli TaxID=28095 RepID=UPI000F52EFA2|nr:hypothetical protein [Burkholderia gladioli]